MDAAKAREEQERMFPGHMLPDICLNLRMSVNGSADPWRDRMLEDCLDFLEARAESWTMTKDMMDFAVLIMVNEAIRIGKAEMACRWNGWPAMPLSKEPA